MFVVERIKLPVEGLEVLQNEAQAEGFRFLETLATEWASGENRFDGEGECLYGCVDDGELVAVGGLNCDPFLADPTVGRLRRIYVRREWRDRSVGTALVKALVMEGKKTFKSLRLRADSSRAAALYERLGFVTTIGCDATHVMRLDE